GCFFDGKRHSYSHQGANDRRRPEQPAPMQRWHTQETQQCESRQHRCSKVKDAKAAEVDHETKNPGKSPALPMSKPGGIDFYHAGRAKSLQITVHTSDGDEKTQRAREGSGSKKNVHHDGAGSANEHRPFASNPVGQQAINDLAASVSEQCGRNNV